MSYFNLLYAPVGRVDRLEHMLNRKYRGAQKFAVKAPDATGTLLIWAHDEEEAREHLVNAMFDMIFRPHRLISAGAENPNCIFCGGGRVQSKGRNSSGTRAWQCMNDECRRAFVLNRTFKGGINHPAQSKKPEFARLILAGVPTAEAATRVGVNRKTATHWAMQIAAVNKDRVAGLLCRCGKPVRHRGICLYRYTPEGRERVAAARRKRRRAA
jgi:transposase-like protein